MNLRISSGWGTRWIRRRRNGPLSEGRPQHLHKDAEKQNAENTEPHKRREPQQRVMLDFDLAELYGIETKYLKRSVK